MAYVSYFFTFFEGRFSSNFSFIPIVFPCFFRGIALGDVDLFHTYFGKKGPFIEGN
jgi:hypothetical protein